MSLVYWPYRVPFVLVWTLTLRAATECQHLSETERGSERQSHKDDGTQYKCEYFRKSTFGMLKFPRNGN